MVRTRGARRALAVAVVVGALQRLAGLSAVIAYTSTTLPADLRALGPVLVSSVLLLASFGPLLLMDRLGRRPLLIASSAVVAASMASNGLYYHFFPTPASGGVNATGESQPSSMVSHRQS